MCVLEISESEFEEKIKGAKVLVDCFAEWCGPCKMLSPIIDELAGEIEDCTFYKLNVDGAMQVPAQYGIMSIPTLLLFENGELVKKSVGFKTKEELKEFIG